MLTQIARTYSLRRRFAEAHAQLDEVEPQLIAAGIRPRLRMLLERGRTFNSAGEREPAQRCFLAAWEEGCAAGEEGLAVDAAHMMAITFAGDAQSLAWSQQGLELAQRSNDTQAKSLIPALLNNAAWDLHDRGEFTEALAYFRQAQSAWEARERPPQIRIARWSVARCLRSLARHTEALDLLRVLEAEQAELGEPDGYVYEEIAENLYAAGQQVAAQPYFHLAAATLARDGWLVEQEPAH
ncbi:MAG: hypothetical protein R2867_08630 [Caldilineaceae bacterium]